MPGQIFIALGSNPRPTTSLCRHDQLYFCDQQDGRRSCDQLAKSNPRRRNEHEKSSSQGSSVNSVALELRRTKYDIHTHRQHAGEAAHRDRRGRGLGACGRLLA